MKKLLLLFIFVLNVFALNFVIGTPKGLESVNLIVKMAIQKGYNRQIWDFLTRIQNQDIDINVKNMESGIYFSNNNKIKFLLKQDKKVRVEFNDFIKALNAGMGGDSAPAPSLKTMSLSNIDTSISFKATPIKDIRKGIVTSNHLDSDFKTILNKIIEYYSCTDSKICMPFYSLVGAKTINVQGNDGRMYRKKLITSFKFLKPDLFFFEHFTPRKEGRRYFLNITIYLVTIDSDGEPNFQHKEIRDFNWRRNYRFIAAQSGQAVREIITKFTGVDIK